MKQLTNPPKTGEPFAIIWFEEGEPRHFTCKWCEDDDMFYQYNPNVIGWQAVSPMREARLFDGVMILVGDKNEQ